MKRTSTLIAACVAVITTCTAQWNPLTSGLTSIRSMTHVGTDLYVATYPSGVKKSTNGGTVWNPVNTGLPGGGGNAFCESVGYNGTFLFAGTQSGIYRSNDGAASWTIANGTLTASSTVFANKWFQNSGVTMAIFSGSIANGGGIWRTSNNGDTWFIGHSGMGSNVVVNSITLVGTTLWACTSVGIYTSIDNGLSWTADAVVNYATYGLAQAGTNLVMLSVFGYRYSTDGGASWNDASGDPSAPSEGELAVYDGLLYANTGGSTGCLKSTDNGLTWAAFNTGLGAIDQASLEEFHIASTKMYVTALFDVYYITGLGLGAADLSAEGTSIFPSVFDQGFTIAMPAKISVREIELIDTRGSIARRIAVTSSTMNVERGTLASGSYRVLGMSSDGVRLSLGTVIAR